MKQITFTEVNTIFVDNLKGHEPVGMELLTDSKKSIRVAVKAGDVAALKRIIPDASFFTFNSSVVLDIWVENKKTAKPRRFTHVHRFGDLTNYVEIFDDGTTFGIRHDGSRYKMYSLKISAAEHSVETGVWKEIF